MRMAGGREQRAGAASVYIRLFLRKKGTNKYPWLPISIPETGDEAACLRGRRDSRENNEEQSALSRKDTGTFRSERVSGPLAGDRAQARPLNSRDFFLILEERIFSSVLLEGFFIINSANGGRGDSFFIRL